MHRLQRIGRGRVSNGSGFGRAFARLCRSDAMLAEMPDFGFMDGGCLSLALAVREWLGPDVARIRFAGRPGRLDHAVAEISIDGRPYLLDGDGMGTWDDVREKLRILEACDGALLVDADPEAAAEHGIEDDGRHRALADILTARFGAVAPHAAWLDADWSEPEATPAPRP
jgi:hypothetical protein